jgi:hypothetical protein
VLATGPTQSLADHAGPACAALACYAIACGALACGASLSVALDSMYLRTAEIREKTGYFISYVIDYTVFYFSKASACNRPL